MSVSEDAAGGRPRSLEGRSRFDHEDAGYHKGLKNRQLQMIAIGGAIGTGLFLGSGGRLNQAGPALAVVASCSRTPRWS
jgi:amino acid permease